MGHVALAARIDLVQQLIDALTRQLREHLAHRAADVIARAGHFDIGVVDVFIEVRRTRQDAHEPGHLAEQLFEVGALPGLAQPLLDAVGGFQRRDEDAADAGGAGRVGRRAVAQGEAGVIPAVGSTLDAQQHVACEHRFALPAEDLLVQSFDLRPDLGPGLAGGPAQRPWMLVAEYEPVAVVVDEHELRPPPQGHRKAGRQHDVDGHAQARRPALHRSQRSGRPVLFPNERRQLLRRQFREPLEMGVAVDHYRAPARPAAALIRARDSAESARSRWSRSKGMPGG